MIILSLLTFAQIIHASATTVLVNAEEGFGCAERGVDKIKNHITKMGCTVVLDQSADLTMSYRCGTDEGDGGLDPITNFAKVEITETVTGKVLKSEFKEKWEITSSQLGLVRKLLNKNLDCN
jgi:hypothetical protein